MKKNTLSAWLAALTAAGVLSLCPVSAATAPLLTGDFETGLDGWTARGTATVSQTDAAAINGVSSAAVTGRSDSWCGISHTLDPERFLPGSQYFFRAAVMQNTTPMAVHFKLSLQYNTGGFGGDVYDCIAEGDAASGMWLTLTNRSYTIPENAQNMSLYLETEDSKADFYADDILAADANSSLQEILTGDVNSSGSVDKDDVYALRDYLFGDPKSDIFSRAADMNNDGKLNAADYTLLKRLLLTHPTVTTTATTSSSVSSETTATTTTQSGNHAEPKAYMDKVRSEMTDKVPANVQSGNTGTITHFTYFSKKANRSKGANIWLPAGYSESQSYPVLYMHHGIMSDENGMLQGFSICEMASNLIASGEAVPFIIVFPQMYTDPNAEMPSGFGFTMNTMDRYDDYLYDLTESLMPYIESHYAVKTGRDNTAVAGFSMGGRESLYLGISRPELFGYVCASSPAPGIVPGVDKYLQHEGSYIPGTNTRMTEKDFRIADDKLPYLLMIAGGTSDSVVGTFPKQYHELFTKNGTDHIWTEVPNGGHDGSVGIPLFYNFFRALFKA